MHLKELTLNWDRKQITVGVLPYSGAEAIFQISSTSPNHIDIFIHMKNVAHTLFLLMTAETPESYLEVILCLLPLTISSGLSWGTVNALGNT